jgi:hypothetical protein
VFQDAGPIEHAVGRGEPGETEWTEYKHDHDRLWFERILSRLSSEGYTYTLTEWESPS